MALSAITSKTQLNLRVIKINVRPFIFLFKSFPDATSGKYTAKYSSIPDKYNIILFSINVLFFLIHLVNTHTTYDSLAGDITEATAQCKSLCTPYTYVI